VNTPMNIPQIDWHYHTDKELTEDIQTIMGFLKRDLTKIERDNCATLLDMMLAEQAERRFKEYERALAVVRRMPA
jgi:hypothetical protein